MLVVRGARALDAMLFSWIHFSDLLAGQGGAARAPDRALILDSLRADAAECIRRGYPSPDVLLVTGDLAFSGDASAPEGEPREYADAGACLERVGAACGLGPERIFVVPGNHDVQWPVDENRQTARLVQHLRNGDEPLDGALDFADERAALAQRQGGYLEFAARFAPWCARPPVEPAARLFWTHREIARGLKVRLVGLNTALLCAKGDADRGRIRLGRRQIEATLLHPPIEEGELVVVLTHHPLRDGWLADEPDVAGWVKKHAHVHLAGHVHDTTVEQDRSGAVDGPFVHVSAGALHRADTRLGPLEGHSYNFGAVVRGNDGALALQVWPRRWSARHKQFRADVDNLPEQQWYAQLSLGLRAGPLPDRPSVDLVSWEEISEPERAAVERLFDHLRRGDFARLNMALKGLPGRTSPLVRAVRDFCERAVRLKLDMSADNLAVIARGVTATLAALGGVPSLYTRYAEVLRPAVLSFAAVLVPIARSPEVKAELRAALLSFARAHADNALHRGLDAISDERTGAAT